MADAERLTPLAEPVLGRPFETWQELARTAHGYVIGGFCGIWTADGHVL